MIFRAFFLLLVSSQTFAYTPSEGKISGTFGPFFYKTNFGETASGAKSPNLADFGLIAQGDINAHSSLEVSIFHMNKVYFREQAGQTLAEQTELVHLTMGYRRWLTSYFSVALGFYSAYPMGEAKIRHNDYPPGTDIDTSARDPSENGAELSIQGEVWSHGKIAVVIDGRYAYSFTNKSNEHGDHYGGLIGIKYLIQERRNQPNGPNDEL